MSGGSFNYLCNWDPYPVGHDALDEMARALEQIDASKAAVETRMVIAKFEQLQQDLDRLITPRTARRLEGRRVAPVVRLGRRPTRRSDRRVREGALVTLARAAHLLESLPGRIAQRIAIDEATGCWLWTGRTSGASGYGRVPAGRGEPTPYAHCVVYELLVGPIPEGLVLDHLCRVTLCVNPDHLEPVTNKENILRGDSFSARLARQTHCIAGHEFTPENTYLYANGSSRMCMECKRRRDREAYRRKVSA